MKIVVEVDGSNYSQWALNWDRRLLDHANVSILIAR
jgi:hypothetical protein